MKNKSVRFLDLVEAGEDNKNFGSGRDWQTTMEYSCCQKPTESLRRVSPPCMPRRRRSLDGSDITRTTIMDSSSSTLIMLEEDQQTENDECVVDPTAQSSPLMPHAKFLFQPSSPAREETRDARRHMLMENRRHSDSVIRISLIKTLL